MKKEHFMYVSEHFNLDQYHQCNAPQWWVGGYEGVVIISEMGITSYLCSEDNETTYNIEGIEGEVVFVNIPTEELAEDILQYIKDTEILFI